MDRRHSVVIGTVGAAVLLGWLCTRPGAFLPGQWGHAESVIVRKEGVPLDLCTMWRAGREDPEVDGSPLDHAAGNHYKSVEVGDTVWFVQIRSGRLELSGRLVVGRITDQDGASEALGASDLTPASFHLLAAEGTVRPLMIRDIHRLARRLQFIDHDGATEGLIISPNDMIDALQLMPLRVLSPESVHLLSEELGRPAPR